MKPSAFLSSTIEKFPTCINGLENWITIMPLVSIDFNLIFKSGLIVLFLLKRAGSILKTEDDICFKTGSGIIPIGT